LLEAPRGWTFIVASELLPGLAEALSVELEATVATWFADDSAGFARLEVRRSGTVTAEYPRRLRSVAPGSRLAPETLSGSSAELREAAADAGIPIAWDPPSDADGVEIRFRM
jgi:hypothetical protein